MKPTSPSGTFHPQTNFVVLLQLESCGEHGLGGGSHGVVSEPPDVPQGAAGVHAQEHSVRPG